jgi:hypothetical protein
MPLTSSKAIVQLKQPVANTDALNDFEEETEFCIQKWLCCMKGLRKGDVIGLKYHQQSFTAMSYRIRNWSEYNAALKQRGSLTFWMDEAVLEQWVIPELSGKPGASNFYSDLAIRTMATVKAVDGLAGRQCQGFLESIFELMEIELTVPNHSTLSRRLGQLAVQ